MPLIGVAERLRRVFDCGADPEVIGAQLARDQGLARRPEAAPGIRVPGAFDGFELAVRAILGQQVSVGRATQLAGRLVATYGKPLARAEGNLTALFPTPSVLAEADLESLGLPRTRAGAIRALARAVHDGRLALDVPLDPQAVVAGLEGLPGIGPWTAQYIAMRALREPDAFPTSDLGLRRAASDSPRPLSERELARRAEHWRPWRAYAAMALWMGAHAGG